jgi:hypothetical protein
MSVFSDGRTETVVKGSVAAETIEARTTEMRMASFILAILWWKARTRESD